jgi:hypothetical protein
MVDGHVHIYDCYDLNQFFDEAINNLGLIFRENYPNETQFQRILLLTESRDNDFFTRFRKEPTLSPNSQYQFQRTKEEASLLLTKKDKPLCYLVQGRQIVTKEKLEILSIASSKKIDDGHAIEKGLGEIRDNKDMALLAWGFGKWSFRRGKTIANILDANKYPYLMLCDNSSRPTFSITPPQFKRAKGKGIPIIAGSDPLPFKGEEFKVGTYGFSVKGNFDPYKPAKSLIDLLISKNLTVDIFGRRDSVFKFFKRQSKIYIKKYLSK